MKGRKFYWVERIIWVIALTVYGDWDNDIYENYKDAIKTGILFY